MRIQIILAGLGGQGILFTTKLISEWGLKQGLDIFGSETHGMSQRGGSVTAHIKLGSYHSPIIREGTANILYSFEEMETYRNLKFLKKKGICFVNLNNKKHFDIKVLDHLKRQGIKLVSYDASSKALEIGSILATNIVLLGYSVGKGIVPFLGEDVISVLKSVSKKKNLAINLKAFEAGVQEGKKQHNLQYKTHK